VPRRHRFLPKVLVNTSPEARVGFGEVVSEDALTRGERVSAAVQPSVESLPFGSRCFELVSADLASRKVLREFNPWVILLSHKEGSRAPTAASP